MFKSKKWKEKCKFLTFFFLSSFLLIRLEIVVCKHQEGQMWQYLVQNDDRGEEVMDPELVSEIHERLAHLCSESEVSS